EEDAERRTLTRVITTFRAEEDGRYRRGEETHRLRLLPEEDVTAWLRAAGFEVRTGTAYGDLELPPGVVTYHARRAG
ncbi:class I SAM-dependent methyltransferase, partial [bacterium]|nr:class I SAM-dependent methyltransferase [bacterium]